MASFTDVIGFSILGFVVTCAWFAFGAYAMGVFFSKNKFEVDGKTILLTGASEGMGKKVAEILASKGASIMIVARNVSKLEAALVDIKSHAKSRTTQRFHYISADVAKPGEALRMLSETTQWNNGKAPEIVWCIAGSSKPQLFLDSDPQTMRQQMDINFWSCADMAHAVLGEWLTPSALQSRGTKHLIFTSSVIAFYTIAGYTPYAPGKAAIRSLADTLTQELLLYSKDVKIHTIFPGTIDSPGLVEENKTKPEITQILEETDYVQSPEDVAKRSVEGLERGETLVTVHWLGSLMRACTWGGTPRHNWVLDTLLMWVTGIIWFFIAWDLNGKVVNYGKKHGHPSTYPKRT